MKITFNSISKMASIISCCSFIILLFMDFFTEVDIENETIFIVLMFTLVSFLPRFLKK